MDKPKFNILDGLIIVLLVLVLAVGVFLIKGMGQGDVGGVSTNTNAVFKIQLTKAEKVLADKFATAKENDEMVWIGTKERFEAKIRDVQIEPTKKITTDLRTGKAILAQDPTCYDVTITVEAAAVETDNAISASGTAIRVGEEAAIRGNGFAGYGFIIGLETVSE